MRLDKLLSNMGYGSRKEIKSHLKKGYITVNDELVKDGARKVNPNQDIIFFMDQKVEYIEFIYLMLHKPQGVISATEDSRDETVLDLITEEERIFQPFPVGRLDKDTEGLLLLTNDGQLAHDLLSPKKHIPKTYYAEIDGVVTEQDKQAFAKGVTLDDGYRTLPAQLKILTSDTISKIELTIYEGKFHQVKRMFISQGKRVRYLKRISMGALQLDPELKLGQYRHLTQEEILKLRER